MEFRRVWRYREDIRRILADQGRPVEDLRTLARRLGRLLNDRLDSQFHWNPSPVLDRGQLVLSGHYEFDTKVQPMKIWINTHPDSRTYYWGRGDAVTWTKFVWDLSECVMHEKVHYLQHRARRGIDLYCRETYDDADRNYYSDPDEIDAYAWSLVSECMDRKGLAELVYPNKDIATVWWNYQSLFPAGHPVRRRLLKKSYKRLIQVLEHGTR